MGSKDALMYKYVYVKAVLSEQRLLDASALLYSVSFMF